MSATIDHLQLDHRVRVLQDFRDARGRRCQTGETAVIRGMELDWPRQEVFIEWEREGAIERLAFSLAAKSGPRSGAMRDYFSVEERVPLFKDTLAGRAQQRLTELKNSVPVLVEQPVNDPSRYPEAVARIWALAARRRFDDGQQQVQLVLSAGPDEPDRLERLAGDMVELAEMYVLSPDIDVYDWLRGCAIDLWYAWGSQATSGGEGTIRGQRIRAAERRIPARP